MATTGISFAGMGSGIDFDSLREALMLVEQQGLARLEEKQDVLQQRHDAYKDIDSRLDSLKSKISSLLDSTSSSVFKKVTASSSNTSVFTATANSTAVSGTYDIKVKNLATADSVIAAQGASVASFTSAIQGTNLNAGALTPATLLSSLNGGAGVADLASGLKITNGVASGVVDVSAATTVGDVLDAINNAGLGVTAAINGTGDGISVTSNFTNRSLAVDENGGTTASNLGIFGSSNVLEIKTAGEASYSRVFLNGAYDLSDATLSMADIRDSINAVSGRKFGASVVDGRLVVQASSVGSANALQVKDSAANGGVLEQLGILTADPLDDATISNGFSTNNTLGGYLQQAADAVFSVNGVTVTRSKNTGISDVISGVTLNLSAASSFSGAGVFPADYASSTLTIQKDTASMTSAVQDFVNQYNSVIDLVSSSTRMDPEGEDGILVGDSIARNLNQSLFAQLAGMNPDLGQNFRSLFDMKDEDGNYVFKVTNSGNGKIELNSTALQNLLEEDPDQVAEVFRYDSNGDGTVDGGLLYKLNQFVASYADSPSGVLQNQMNSLSDQVDDLDTEMDRKLEILQAKDDALKRQFSAADTLIATLQSQSNYIASQLAALKG